MTPRSVCIVPGCANSSAKFAGSRYICSRHWPLISKAAKAEYRKRWREADRATGDDRVKRSRRAWRYWYALEREAIEAAAGL